MASSPVQQRSDSALHQIPGHFTSLWSQPWLVALLVVFATLPYANTVLNGFVYDDSDQILANPYIRSARYLPQILTTSVWSFRETGATTNYYRPMMTLGYLACYKLFGLSPSGFHSVNLLLHILVVLILFLVTRRMFRDRMLALGAAMLFAMHPIHTESVGWIGAVTDLEVTFFGLLTFWFFLKAEQPGGRRSEPMHLAMAVSFVLALLSKEQALTLPFLATLFEHFYRQDRAETTLREKFSRYRVLWMLTLIYVLLRVRFIGAFAPVRRFSDLAAYQIVLSAFALLGQYIGKVLWPAHLSAFYMFHKSSSLLEPRVLAGIGGLLIGAVLFTVLWKRDRIVSFGLVWFVVTLAPVLNAQWVGLNVFAERYLYLPSVGFSWVAGWGLWRLWIASSRRAVVRKGVASALAALALVCVFRILMRNRDWQNDMVLCNRTLAGSPDAYPVRMNLGTVYAKKGNLQRAEQLWLEVLKSAPDNVTTLNNLGNLYLTERRVWDAIGSYQRAIQTDPKSAGSHLNLGYAYTLLGLLEEAELQLRAGVALSPRDSKGYAGLGVVYCAEGDHDQAESYFQRALSINPSDDKIHLLRANCYAKNGRTTEAAREYQAAVAIDPQNTAAVEGLLSLGAHHLEAK